MTMQENKSAKTPLNIVVLQGGASAEGEVSRKSAAQVAAALSQAGHQATTVELDEGCTKQLLNIQPDVVFPALHGPPGEDGTVQGYLEMLGLPYVGSDVRGSAIAMDKHVAKLIFVNAGLPVVPDVRVDPQTPLDDAVEDVRNRLGTAVVVKPLNQGSAIGVTPLPNGGDVKNAIRAALKYGSCLVEPYVLGREITVGVLEVEDRLVAHPVIEIVTDQEEWYDYENRYTPGQSEHIVPAPLPDEVLAELQRIALTAHTVLGLRDLSRADFIVTDDDEITLLEVNSLPGMTPTSLYPDGAQHLGYSFEQLIDHLVHRAKNRG